MKQPKKMLMVILATAMIVAMDYAPMPAASVAGKTETNAIELKLGKKRTNKFWTGSADPLYYVVTLPDQGILSISVAAESLGTGATVQITQKDNIIWNETKSFSYSKKKKATSGTLKSASILPKGNYIVQVTPGKTIKKTKKLTITAKYKASKFADKEPNNSEESAQTIKVYGNTPTYKMYLNNMTLFEVADLTDCMKFNLKADETVSINLKSKANMSNVKVLIREKTADGFQTIQSYDVVDGKLSKKLSLKKGTYYLKVWCTDDSLKVQMPYTIQCKA